MPDESTPARKRAKRIFASKDCDWHEQLDAFVTCMRRHAGRSALKEREWKRCYGLYAGLRHLAPEAHLQVFWQLVEKRKEGRLQLAPKALAVIDCFAHFNALRDTRWKKRAVRTGYWVEREKLKKAKDPDGYRARAAERQRQCRARKRVEKLVLDDLRFVSDYDVAAE